MRRLVTKLMLMCLIGIAVTATQGCPKCYRETKCESCRGSCDNRTDCIGCCSSNCDSPGDMEDCNDSCVYARDAGYDDESYEVSDARVNNRTAASKNISYRQSIPEYEGGVAGTGEGIQRSAGNWLECVLEGAPPGCIEGGGGSGTPAPIAFCSEEQIGAVILNIPLNIRAMLNDVDANGTLIPLEYPNNRWHASLFTWTEGDCNYLRYHVGLQDQNSWAMAAIALDLQGVPPIQDENGRYIHNPVFESWIEETFCPEEGLPYGPDCYNQLTHDLFGVFRRWGRADFW